MKLIRFVPAFSNKEEMLLEPTPIKEHMPEWYRTSEHTFTNNGQPHPGLKSCSPFLDSLLTGYCLVTPFDIFIGRKDDGSIDIRWNGPDVHWDSFIGERHKELAPKVPRPAGHAPNGLVWSSKWGWKTPRGWSTMVTHPLNRHDLPFTTLSGVIDSDKFTAHGNMPFFIKEDFVGIIPAGTPYAQIIPFKRKSWKKIADYGLISRATREGSEVRLPKRSYKQRLWVRKSYN
jgi:hypothetical protein